MPYPFTTVHITRPRVRRIFVLLIIGTAILLSIVGGLTMLQAESAVHSSSEHRLPTHITPKTLLMAVGGTIPYLDERMGNQGDGLLSRLVFELMTSINPHDPRTLLGRELPMFALFDANIIAASPGVDYTAIPIDSPPPPELEKAIIEGANETETELDAAKNMLGQPQVLIYHTHYWESYLSEVGEKRSSRAVSLNKQKNINRVGSRLAARLRAMNVGAIASQTQPKTNSRSAYSTSRKKVQQVLKQHPKLTYLIDIHRDSRPRSKTTVQFNGQAYARLAFVVGKSSRNYEQNRELAKKIHQQLNHRYPGISSAVIEKPRTRGINGEYNQSLSPNSLLVEVGGIGNNFKEAYRSIDILATVLGEQVLEAVPVSQ